jgi:hypothetical protein
MSTHVPRKERHHPLWNLQTRTKERHGKKIGRVNHITSYIALGAEAQDSVVRRGDAVRTVAQAKSTPTAIGRK